MGPHITDAHPGPTERPCQAGTVGARTLHGNQELPFPGTSVHPVGGTGDTWRAGRKRCGVLDLSGRQGKNGVGVGFGMGVHAYDMGVLVGHDGHLWLSLREGIVPNADPGRVTPRQFSNESRPLPLEGAGQPSMKPSKWARKVQPRPGGHVRSRTLPWQVRK